MIGCKERIFDYEYLRKFEAKIEKAFTVEEGTDLHNFHSAFSPKMLNELGMRSRGLQFYISLAVK